MQKGKLNRYFTVLLMLVFICVFTRGAYAFIARTGDSVKIESDEVIKEDLYTAGGDITIDGTVNGDVYAAGQKVTVNGAVRDNAVILAQEVHVTGSVGGTLKAFGQNLEITGNVSEDLLIFGANVEIKDTAKVGGDTLFGARNISIAGPMKKDILGAGQNVTINSTVKGNVRILVQNLIIGQSALIGGNLKYVSENEAEVLSGAQIKGVITHSVPEWKEKMRKAFPFILITGIIGKIIGFFMAIVVGLVFILITPAWMRSLTDSIAEKPGSCAGWGALIFFATPIGILIAAATVIGMPLAGISLLLYLVALYMSQIAVSLLIGRLIVGREKSAESKAVLFGAFVLGLFIISLVRFIPVVGYLILLVCGIFGMGAIVIAEAVRRKTRASA